MTGLRDSVCDIVLSSFETWIHTCSGPKVLGICGSQGSGKSTLARQIAETLKWRGMRVAVLSLDDLYFSSEDREALGRDIHPLFRTRGVPGTHNVQQGVDVIGRLKSGATVQLPRFDKSRDNPFPVSQWESISDEVDLVIFEGWCVGAVPELRHELVNPLNALERQFDRDAKWRIAVNDFLAGPYQKMFSYLDRLVLLAAPSFEVVKSWRIEQEKDLGASLNLNSKNGQALMSSAEIEIFVQHFERISRHILREMPARADLTVFLDEMRRPKSAGSS